jgi:hypothetical protein
MHYICQSSAVRYLTTTLYIWFLAYALKKCISPVLFHQHFKTLTRNLMRENEFATELEKDNV